MTLADELATKPSGTVVLGKLAELLDRNGISVDDVGCIAKVNLWQGFHKGEDGEAQVVDLAGITFSPAWESGPQWPVIAPGPAVRLPVPKVSSVATTSPCAVVWPDCQIGYFRGADGELVPTHDEDAITVALAITKAAKPAQVVLVGDNLDLPELGKYRLSPAFQRTTQATIDRATTLCAQLRAAAPEAQIVWLAGNHEERLPSYILDNAMAAFGLRRGNAPESWPVMSVPYLCRFDDYGITYLPGYPASSHWITERVRVIHGAKVAAGGSTAHKYLATEKTSVIFGHVHRREWAERTRDDYDGPKTILAASPGCLARTDGAVPSTKGGIDLDGRPLTSHEDWQQGVAVVPYDPADGRFWYEQVPIRDGVGFWRGKEYAA